MNDIAVYHGVFDRREVGALRCQLDDFRWIRQQDTERVEFLEKSLRKSVFQNNFMLVAFMASTLFALAFCFLLRQEQHQNYRLRQNKYTAQVERDKAEAWLEKTRDHLHWLERVTTFTPTREGNWWLDNFEVTAYTNSPDEVAPYYDGFTAIMTKADWRRNIVAVDPTVVPLRSSMWIKGRGWVRAEDTGGAIKGNRIDMLVEKKKQAFNYGRRKNVPVIVIPPKGFKPPTDELVEMNLPIENVASEVAKSGESWHKKLWYFVTRSW